MNAPDEARIRGGVSRPLAHESAHLHVTGAASYVDDVAAPSGCLHAALGLSERAHAEVVSIDLDAVRAAPGVRAVITAADIPGRNDCGPVVADDPIFADGVVEYHGQALFAVAADEVTLARRAARLARVEYADREPLLTIEAARAAGAHLLPTRHIVRGDADAAIARAAHRLEGEVVIGGQEQFYLEGQVALAIPGEDGTMRVSSSTQHPSEVQAAVAHALGRPGVNDVTVECRRMGGGFGGKETQPALFACIAALLARRTGRAVKLRMDRDDDIRVTGKRHDFVGRYRVGFDARGRIEGYAVELASRCGRSADLSGPINDRAMFHADNAYHLPDVAIVSHRFKTHTASNTAFRGFGGPQGMLVVEQAIDDIARHLGLDALDVRRENLYGVGGRDVTPYGQTVTDNVLPRILDGLERSSDYRARRAAIAAFNASSPVVKRGIALTPVKFGISFTNTPLNQAGALVHVYADGSVQLNHGGTEMGQGLHTKVSQVVAEAFGIDVDRIRVTATDTGKVPNTSATAASSGSDLNGMAALVAARAIRDRLRDFAAGHFGVEPGEVSFEAGQVHAGAERVAFGELARRAWLARVHLSAAGYYRTPRIGFDPDTMTGRPFYYFAYGAAVSEAVVDTLTGESRIDRVDILHDCGRSLNPAIDRGQIEGGYAQGVGWLTSEELWWDDAGRLATHAPSTYKIPVCSDWPTEAHVEILESAANREDTVHRSKAVGEPPLMLALSAFLAIADAVVAARGGRPVRLAAPATPEAILTAIDAEDAP